MKPEKIDGVTPKEWADNDNLTLVIKDGDRTVRFSNHYIRGEPAWPPLEANGDSWEIIEV